MLCWCFNFPWNVKATLRQILQLDNPINLKQTTPPSSLLLLLETTMYFSSFSQSNFFKKSSTSSSCTRSSTVCSLDLSHTASLKQYIQDTNSEWSLSVPDTSQAPSTVRTSRVDFSPFSNSFPLTQWCLQPLLAFLQILEGAMLAFSASANHFQAGGPQSAEATHPCSCPLYFLWSFQSMASVILLVLVTSDFHFYADIFCSPFSIHNVPSTWCLENT